MEGQAPPSFARRVGTAAAIVVAVAAVGLVLWSSVRVLMLAFAGVLVAVMLRAMARWVAVHTGWRIGWALGAVVTVLLLALIGLGLVAAPQIARQVDALADRLPQSAQKLQDQLAKREWIRETLDLPPPAPAPATRPVTIGPPTTSPTSAPSSQPTTSPTEYLTQAITGGSSPGIFRNATRFVGTMLNLLVTVVVVFVVAIYLAAQPRLYINGLLRLVPPARRPRLRRVMRMTGRSLVGWLLGQGVTMIVIAVLTALGLWALGVELWLILGVLAGLFNFVPNFGPFVSYIPAVLIGGVDGIDKVLWISVLFLVLQSLEGYVLTPLVQRKAVDMPPALTIIAQVVLGALVGAIGVVLAAPLTAAAIVLVRELYVVDVLERGRQHRRSGSEANPSQV